METTIKVVTTQLIEPGTTLRRNDSEFTLRKAKLLTIKFFLLRNKPYVRVTYDRKKTEFLNRHPKESHLSLREVLITIFSRFGKGEVTNLAKYYKHFSYPKIKCECCGHSYHKKNSFSQIKKLAINPTPNNHYTF